MFLSRNKTIFGYEEPYPIELRVKSDKMQAYFNVENPTLRMSWATKPIDYNTSILKAYGIIPQNSRYRTFDTDKEELVFRIMSDEKFINSRFTNFRIKLAKWISP